MSKRKLIKRDITEEQFLTLLSKAIKTKSDSASVESSESHLGDGCNEKRTHSDKTGDI